MIFSDISKQQQIEDLRQLLYTPIDKAVDILDARQKQNLKLPSLNIADPLSAYWGRGCKPQPRTAIMLRQIATPNYEMRRVVQLCEKYHLNLLILTIEEDKFCPNNPCKYASGRMGFFEGLGRNGGRKIRYSTIINFNQYNGYPIRECKTFRGKPFMDFHHNLFLQEFPQLTPQNIIDCSKWVMQHQRLGNNLYRASLELFLQHAILFETFVLSNCELDITLMKVLPAFQEIVNNFGIKPLIVHSEDPDMEGDNYWQLYPDHLHALAPYDRRKTPRYEAPFDNFTPAIINHKKWTIGSK
ncbi:conserved hypothetical protein [Crenothrix polyspora]|uniref:Uncharacterized protein n=1 Tax=Crenothrix polyspora TaxID=360316 RepID=A0A1R4HHZ3_9GAMM|nr:hypothetical protein [Crenothrix polyspora]SJM95856.1 conserved hypothetical protein [Crenothrix polyspora]